MMALPSGNEETYTTLVGPKNSKDAPEITWSNVHPKETRGRESTKDVLVDVPSTLKSRKAKTAQTPAAALQCFISDNIVDKIVIYTNTRIEHSVLQMLLRTKNSDKNCNYKQTDAIEVRALFGLMFLRGTLRQNNIDQQFLWTEDFHHLFGATISRSRFVFCRAILHVMMKCLVPREGGLADFPVYRKYMKYSTSNVQNISFCLLCVIR